ncbi:MAG: heme o synthase [Saprospiraceae bacterium]
MRLSLTVVFSSVLAFLIGAQGAIDWVAVLILAGGGFMVTGAANTLNQVLEREFDAKMKRTAGRPLAGGRMSVSEAVLAAGVMSLIGISLLAFFNPWTAFLGTLALVLYAFVYTPLKRISPIAIPVGAVPGALPTLIGVVAAEGTITSLGITLFFIQFLWQFPHFWSIGWLGFEDYKGAGYRFIPEYNGQPDPSVTLQALVYAFCLVPVAVVPYLLGETGIVSAIILGVLSIGYVGFAWNFYRKQHRKSALALMFFSFSYIPLGLIALFLDKI